MKVALLGNPNSGKSTLFNRLCGSDVYVANQLFATLDPTLRRIDVPELGPVILADTVGFIRHLPHDLVEAFRATLEEVCEADLLLHVVDVSDPRMQSNITQVNSVLESIDADSVPQVWVYNKIDLLPALPPKVEAMHEQIMRAWVSAQAGLGIEDLQKSLVAMLGQNMVQRLLILKPQDAKVRASLYQLNAVLSETIDEDGNCHLLVRLPKVELERLFH